MSAEHIRYRKFSRCKICLRDIAAWLTEGNWWHMDSHIHHDHLAEPSSTVVIPKDDSNAI